MELINVPFISGPAPFEFNAHTSDSAIEWMNWVRGFELFAKASKIDDDAIKCSSLLHSAGPKFQKVFFNLPPIPNVLSKGPLAEGYGFFQRSEYDETILRLESFFAPKRNATYECHVFRKMKQEADERIEIFAMRIRTQADRCEFGEQLKSNIIDQLTEGCTSSLLRRKILERGDDGFDSILILANVIETVSEQQKMFDRNDIYSKTAMPTEEVNQIQGKTKFSRTNEYRRTNGGCGRCGYNGHKSADNKCPAIGKTCAKCGGKNQFARKCLTRGDRNERNGQAENRFKRSYNETKSSKAEPKQEPPEKKNMQESTVQLIDNSEYDYVFCVSTMDFSNEIQCKVGGITLKAIIDSGSKYNIMDYETWNMLKASSVQTISREKGTDKVLVAKCHRIERSTIDGVILRCDGRR